MIAFPLDNTEYTAEALGAWCGTRTRGVFSADNNLRVTTNGDLTITVSPGVAWLKPSKFWGVSFLLKEAQILASDTADGALTRYDAVCVRIDKNQNIEELVLKKGSYGTNPPYPTLVRDLNYEEIFLAAIKRRPGATTILASDIIPLVLDEHYCGIMRDAVTGIPTQALFDMWTAWFTKQKSDARLYFSSYQQMVADLFSQYQTEIGVHADNARAVYEAYVARTHAYENASQADFEAWVETLKDILDGEAAGHLQLEIEALQSSVPASVLGTVSIPATVPLYPRCGLYKTTWAFGVGGAGLGPAGGGGVVAISAGAEFNAHEVTVSAPVAFSGYTNITQLSDTMFAFMADSASEPQSIVLQITN